jgi:copper chaperone NosL
MTIVDRQHASQLVTSKGKVYKFDAIECMINYADENQDTEYAHTVICDFKQPGELIDATKAAYLISPEISSPMGAFLSGFKTKEEAIITQKEYGGSIYNWIELNNHFKNKINVSSKN